MFPTLPPVLYGQMGWRARPCLFSLAISSFRVVALLSLLNLAAEDWFSKGGGSEKRFPPPRCGQGRLRARPLSPSLSCLLVFVALRRLCHLRWRSPIDGLQRKAGCLVVFYNSKKQIMAGEWSVGCCEIVHVAPLLLLLFGEFLSVSCGAADPKVTTPLRSLRA